MNFQNTDLKSGVEKLVQRNSDVNKEIEDLRKIEEFVFKSYDNRIIYNINQNTPAILEDLLDIIEKYLMQYFRKYKLLLVRPSTE